MPAKSFASEIEDYTGEWTFDPNTFDFIHLRWLLGSVPNWDALFEEAYKATKPGGWVQSHEPSCIYKSDHTTIKEDSALGQWGKFYIEGGKKMGNSCLIVEDDLQKKGMEAAGFVDIQEFNYKVGSRFRGRGDSVLTVLLDTDGTLA